MCLGNTCRLISPLPPLRQVLCCRKTSTAPAFNNQAVEHCGGCIIGAIVLSVIKAQAICPAAEGQALHLQFRDQHCIICAGSVRAAITCSITHRLCTHKGSSDSSCCRKTSTALSVQRPAPQHMCCGLGAAIICSITHRHRSHHGSSDLSCCRKTSTAPSVQRPASQHMCWQPQNSHHLLNHSPTLQ